MNYSTKLKKYLAGWYQNSEIIFILFFLFLTISTLNSYRIDTHIKPLVVTVSLIAIVLPRLLKDWKIWFLISSFLTVNLYLSYFFTANHLFISTYFSWIVTLVLFKKEKLFPSLKIASKWLLALVMGMATIHKIISPLFMNGSFISLELLLGLRKFVLVPIFWPDIQNTVNENTLTLINIYQDSSLREVSKSIVSPKDNFFLFSKIYSFLILAYEAILFIFLIIYPKYKKIVHISIILFVWLTYLYTNENSFFSVFCILAYLMTDKSDKKIRLTYITTIVIMLTMAGLSFRPAFLGY